MVLSLTAAKIKPLTFSMSGFVLSYTTNMFTFMILYDFCLLPSQVHVYIRKVESRVQIVDRCEPTKISTGAENLDFQTLQLPGGVSTDVTSALWRASLMLALKH
jgi:hypothetical protein